MTSTVEFSHKVTVNPWPDEGVIVKLTATAAECEALKARFDLADLQSLSASVGIEKKVMELVLAGTIEAVVAQTCVVTLKPVTSSLNVPFERHYRRRDEHEKMIKAGHAASLDEDDADVEILDGDDIDLGEAVAEEFFLALDPYPRSAGADLVLEEIGAKSDTDTDLVDKPANPFEQLLKH